MSFRNCPVTGLKVESNAETLIKVNAVTAIVCFLVGVIAALLLVLTRWQAVHLLPATWYYRILTAHGLNMLIFFIIFFEVAILYFAGPVMLRCRLPAPRVAWAAYALMLIGTLMVEYFVFAGKADVLFTSYVPLRAHPGYYLGIILFAVGTLVAVTLFFASLVVARREKTYEGSVPLVTFGAHVAAVIAVITLLHGAAIYIPTFLWSLNLMQMDAEVYRMVWWGLGHSSQQINVAAHVAVWYLMAGLTVGGVVLNEKISRLAYVLYVLFISMASAHHLLVDPGPSPAWKIWNTSYAMYLAVLASMIHGFTVPAGIEAGMRLRGFNKGRFQWLTRAPWGDPGFSATALSVVIFGFGGGITGVTIGTEQINIIAHNTLRIPGHFHMTVVGGTALAFMGLTYYVLPLIFRRRVAFWGLAKWQPYLFGIGVTIVGIAQTYAGSFGVPRRHWDISFTNAPVKVHFPAAVDLFLAIMALGGVIAFLGGLSYVLIAVASVLGKPLTDEDLARGGPGLPPGVVKLPPQTYTVEQSEEIHAKGCPGTVVLVYVFLGAFVLYYFANWKILSVLWRIQ
ncbi:MAG: cbb3-type cytochrome c oxidase subunit I [Candidatus Eremiobacterota bacterium]